MVVADGAPIASTGARLGGVTPRKRTANLVGAAAILVAGCGAGGMSACTPGPAAAGESEYRDQGELVTSGRLRT